MHENYKKFLDFLNTKLDKFFDEQKPYIACKKGCAKCCKNAEFPFSALEVSYLAEGIKLLDEKTQDIVGENMAKINQAKENFKGDKFLYDCPFLIDDICSVYEYRGIICRTFGLIYTGEDGKGKIPFCYADGLNFSNVMDFEKKMITQEKFEQLGVKEEPHAYNISYGFLTDKDMEIAFGIKFGEKKPLIDWFDTVK